MLFFTCRILRSIFKLIYNKSTKGTWLSVFCVHEHIIQTYISKKIMRKDILTKLKSNSGASLMAALLFFIMCATVGSFVLAAATASSGRLAGLKRNEQAHYAVNSAADLIAGLVQDEHSKVIIQLTKEYPLGDTGDTEEMTFIDPKTGSPLSASDENQIMLTYLVNTVYPLLRYDSAFPDRSNPVKGELDTQIGVQGYEDLLVNAKITLDASLNLSVEIKSATAGNSETITLHFQPVVEETEKITHHNMNETVGSDGDKRNSVYLKTYTIRWTDPVME